MPLILVTGAAGFFGSAITRALLAAGHAVRALVEPGDPAPGLAGLAVERAVGDVLEPSSLAAACQGCQAVVHAAGWTSMRVARRSRLRLINVDGTRNICQAALAAGVPKLVYISSLGVLGGHPAPLPVNEISPAPNAMTQRQTYHRSKIRAEGIALSFTSLGPEVCAVLPGMLWGPGDWSISSTGLARLVLKQRRALYPPGGTALLHVDDAAQGVLLALERGQNGRRYVLAGDNLTNEQFFTMICQAAHPGLSPKPVSLGLVTITALVAEGLGRLGWDVDFSLDTRRLCGIYWWGDDSRARKELGWSPAHSAAETIAATVAWHWEHLKDLNANKN
ncbi:MAG: NAD-dependent epimerase/dehydratase family protein [candidate division FCPU426 bacterium]